MATPSLANDFAIVSARALRLSRGSRSATKYPVSTRTLRATLTFPQIVIDLLRAVRPPPRPRLARQCHEERSTLRRNRCRHHRLVSNEAMDLHFDFVAWPNADHVGRDGEFVVERELHVVVVPTAAAAAADRDQHQAVVGSALEP